MKVIIIDDEQELMLRELAKKFEQETQVFLGYKNTQRAAMIWNMIYASREISFNTSSGFKLYLDES